MSQIAVDLSSLVSGKLLVLLRLSEIAYINYF
jgi:hypothetical protein